MKKKSNLETVFENLGNARVDSYRNRSLKLRQHFSSNRETRKHQVKEIQDYIFGKTEDNPLQEIYDEYQKDLSEVENRVQKYVKRYS